MDSLILRIIEREGFGMAVRLKVAGVDNAEIIYFVFPFNYMPDTVGITLSKGFGIGNSFF
jgi:hypothetical protein